MKDVEAHLALAAEPVRPRPELRARVLAEAARARRAEAPPFDFVRADEGIWKEVQPGVAVKLLAGTPRARSAYLVRMAPGAQIANHEHRGDEHCYVLHGDVRAAGGRLAAGDYHRARAGTVHESVCSDGGCLLLIVEERA